MLVSAVIITHNRLELLKRALESVRNQTYSPLEVIVVDDASSDGTDRFFGDNPELADRYIHILPSESRGGNHARNVGVEAAHGEWVAFLDDDDEWFPEKIAKQVEVARANPSCDVIGCKHVLEYDFKDRVHVKGAPKTGWLDQDVLSANPYSTSLMMVRRERLLEIGGFDESLTHWQEYEMEMRLLQKTPVAASPEELVLYRIASHDGARLSNQLARWEQTVWRIEEKHADMITSAPLEVQSARLQLIALEGAYRAEAVGDERTKRVYLGVLCDLAPSFRNKLRLRLNRAQLRRGLPGAGIRSLLSRPGGR